MNIVFWFIVAVCAVLLWLAISFLFIPLGKKITKKARKMSDILSYEDDAGEKEGKKTEKEEEEN